MELGLEEVVTGFLPGGNSSIMEVSREPYTVIARVLGIGVAVIINWWGLLFLEPPFSSIENL